MKGICVAVTVVSVVEWRIVVSVLEEICVAVVVPSDVEGIEVVSVLVVGAVF